MENEKMKPFIKNMLKSTIKTSVQNTDDISSPIVEAVDKLPSAKDIAHPIVSATIDMKNDMVEAIKDLKEDKDEVKKVEIVGDKADIASAFFSMLRGEKGEPGDDGHTPTEEELKEIIEPLIPEPIKGDDGKDYVLTVKDKKEIAKSIKVPVVEKVVETIIEKPIVTNNIEVKEVAVADKADVIKVKLESLEGDDRLDAKAIKNLPKPSYSGGGGIKRIDGASDTRIINPTEGQVLTWNTARQVWENTHGETAGFVPYTGATADVDLGTHGLYGGDTSTIDPTLYKLFFEKTVNDYFAIGLKNGSAEDSSSADFTTSANNDGLGLVGHYTNMGINGSGWIAANAGNIKTASVNAGGTGYTVGDVLALVGGDNNANVTVLTAPGGVVATVSVTDNGTGYSVATGLTTTGGTGSACTIDVLSLIDYSGQSANGGYFTVVGGDMMIATDGSVANKGINFATGGFGSSNIRASIDASGNFKINNYLGVGSLSTPGVAVSDIPSLSAQNLLASAHITALVGDDETYARGAFYSFTRLSNTTTCTKVRYSFSNYLEIPATNTQNATGTLVANRAYFAHRGTGTLSFPVASYNSIENRSTGTLGSSNAATGTYSLINNVSTGTITLANITQSQLFNSSTGTVTATRMINAAVNNNGGGTIGTLGMLTTTFAQSNAASVTTNLYGISLSGGAHSSVWTNTGTVVNSWGIYIGTGIDLGSTSRYCIQSLSTSDSVFAGNFGIGQTARPTAKLHLGAGTASASTAPLKFTSGTLNTTPEAGAVEFLTDKFYGTITTGAVRKEIKLHDSYYGELYAYDKAIALNIVVADTYHAIHLATAGDIVTGLVSGFSFIAGRAVDANITSEASGTGGKLRVVCSGAHGLTTGDLVVLGNMNNAGHNKPTRITTDGTNPTTEFLCDDITYVAGAGVSAGFVDEPSQLKASTGSAGKYMLTFVIDGTAAAANKAWKFEANVNVTATDNIVSERTSTNSLASMSSGGLITVADGDRIWLAGKNATDTSDYTIKNMSLTVVRI